MNSTGGRLILLLFSFLISLSMASAQATCGFAQTIEFPHRFSQVEAISRNHSIGLWRGGDVRLERYVQISQNAYLGIDKEGRLLNVIRLHDRVIGYLLSGERKIKDLFFHLPGQLLAIDQEDRLLQFSQKRWNKDSLRKIWTEAAFNYTTAQCVTGMAVIAYSWITGTPTDSLEIMAALGLSGIAGLGSEGLRVAAQFQDQNEVTDGFIPLNVRLEGFRNARYVFDNEGTITDYLLNTQKGETSLLRAAGQGLLDQPGPSFDVTCAHDLLARGVPPQNYEYNFKKEF